MATAQMTGGSAFSSEFNANAGFAKHPSSSQGDVIDGEFSRDDQDKISKS